MKSVPLNAFPRTQSRRNGARNLRASGRVPAVIYGGKTEPKILELNAKEIGDLLHHSISENLLVDLAIEKETGAKRLALVQEIQHHPLSGKILHVDFHEVSPTEKVTVMVPVETTGEAAGVKNDGGVLEHALFKLKVRALPKDLPEVISIDVTELKLNQTVHIGDIKVADGVEILGDKKISVISVAMPRTEVEETTDAAATAAAGDVEMTKEKKVEGAEGAAPAKAADKGAEKKAEKAPEKKK